MTKKTKKLEKDKTLNDCCEAHIRNVYEKIPTIVGGRIDCPKCGHFWGFTGFGKDIDNDIQDLKKQMSKPKHNK